MEQPRLNYEIALINVWWDSNSIDTRFFSNTAEQKQYFEDKISYKFSPLLNFKMADNIRTRVTYRDESDRPPHELVECNYAVVRRLEVNGGVIERHYRYYFAKVYQDSGNQMTVDLELDDIQTNYFTFKHTIAECVIERAHLDRFVPSDYNEPYVTFDLSINSELHVDDFGAVPKRLLYRRPISFGIDTNEVSQLNDFLNTQFKSCWALVYLNKSIYTTFVMGRKNLIIDDVDVPYVLAVAPVFDLEYVNLQLDNNTTFHWNFKDLYDILNFKELWADVLAIKFTPNCPLNAKNYKYNTDYSVGGGGTQGLTLKASSFDIFTFPVTEGVPNPPKYLTILERQTKADKIGRFEMSNVETQFLKEDIVGAFYSSSFNPKKLSMSCYDLRICDYAGNAYTYDPSKFEYKNESNEIVFLLNEPLTPDITKMYVRCDSGLYKSAKYSYTGLVVSNDTSLLYDVSQLQQFLAENKNFFLQQQSQRDYSWLTTGISTASQFFQDKKIDVGGVISTIAANEFHRIKQNFMYNNMAAAPTSIQNAQSSLMLNLLINPNNKLDMFIEVHSAIPADMEKYLNLYNLFGFGYGKVGRLGDFDNIRKLFNYISAAVDVISAPISNEEKDRLRSRLKEIRFWNSDVVSYEMENYERWLENE